MTNGTKDMMMMMMMTKNRLVLVGLHAGFCGVV
jgi:hypothetical protein